MHNFAIKLQSTNDFLALIRKIINHTCISSNYVITSAHTKVAFSHQPKKADNCIATTLAIFYANSISFWNNSKYNLTHWLKLSTNIYSINRCFEQNPKLIPCKLRKVSNILPDIWAQFCRLIISSRLKHIIIDEFQSKYISIPNRSKYSILMDTNLMLSSN